MDGQSILITANFLVNTLMTVIGLLIIVCGVLIADNLIHRFWKPIKLIYMIEQEPNKQKASQEKSK